MKHALYNSNTICMIKSLVNTQNPFLAVTLSPSGQLKVDPVVKNLYGFFKTVSISRWPTQNGLAESIPASPFCKTVDNKLQKPHSKKDFSFQKIQVLPTQAKKQGESRLNSPPSMFKKGMIITSHECLTNSIQFNTHSLFLLKTVDYKTSKMISQVRTLGSNLCPSSSCASVYEVGLLSHVLVSVCHAKMYITDVVIC